MFNHEAALTESKTLREECHDRTDVLDKVKALALLPDDVHVTTEGVADYYEVPASTIESLAANNAEELESNGRRVLKGAELQEFAAPFGGVANLGISPKGRSLAVFTRRAVLNVGMLLRDSEVARQVRTYLLNAETQSLSDAVKAIRQSEKVNYRKLTDAIALTAVDYNSTEPEVREFFAMIQNILHYAVTGMRAKEIIANREIRTWTGKKGPTQRDRQTAKNYLTEGELDRMEKLTHVFLLSAELDLVSGKTVTMESWGTQLLSYLNYIQYHILPEATNFRQLPTAD